jgi:ribosomal protein S18 acetylase RimI-like enzyme
MEDAFSEHFGFEAVDLETWVKAWTGSPSWQPQLVTLATIDGAIVGGVVAFVSDTPGLGWVADIGVLEAHRGRGIAHVLLMRSFSDLAARGCTRVRLNVDSENASGATRLYDRVGMTVRREWLVFEKVLTHD